MDTLSNPQIAVAGLADWRKLAQALHARFVAADPAAAAVFAVGALDVAHGRHLDIHLSGSTVDMSTSTREDGRWVTADDLDAARAISSLAADQGLRSAPSEVTQLELALDTADDERIAPFWAALLTGSDGNRIYDSVFDPTDRVPSVWFQGRAAEDSTPSQRWHFDLWLAPEAADERIAAAVAGGGTVVDAAQAPSFTVLADPEGNQVCVCTSLERA